MVAENEAVLAPSQEEEKVPPALVPPAPQDEGVLATPQEEPWWMTDPPDPWYRYEEEPGGWVDIDGFTPPEAIVNPSAATAAATLTFADALKAGKGEAKSQEPKAQAALATSSEAGEATATQEEENVPQELEPTAPEDEAVLATSQEEENVTQALANAQEEKMSDLARKNVQPIQSVLRRSTRLTKRPLNYYREEKENAMHKKKAKKEV